MMELLVKGLPSKRRFPFARLLRKDLAPSDYYVNAVGGDAMIVMKALILRGRQWPTIESQLAGSLASYCIRLGREHCYGEGFTAEGLRLVF